MKDAITAFLVSTKGSILIPLATAFVAMVVTLINSASPDLANAIDQSAVAAWIVAAFLAVLNYYNNSKQTDGVKAIQEVAKAVQQKAPDLSIGQRAVDVDGVPGPITTKVVTDLLGKLLPKK